MQSMRSPTRPTRPTSPTRPIRGHPRSIRVHFARVLDPLLAIPLPQMAFFAWPREEVQPHSEREHVDHHGIRPEGEHDCAALPHCGYRKRIAHVRIGPGHNETASFVERERRPTTVNRNRERRP